jgi:hypothetical protein
MTNQIDYNICLWKHSKDVEMSPRGVVYVCYKCEKNKIPSVQGKPRARKRNRVRQVSALVK